MKICLYEIEHVYLEHATQLGLISIMEKIARDTLSPEELQNHINIQRVLESALTHIQENNPLVLSNEQLLYVRKSVAARIISLTSSLLVEKVTLLRDYPFFKDEITTLLDVYEKLI